MKEDQERRWEGRLCFQTEREREQRIMGLQRAESRNTEKQPNFLQLQHNFLFNTARRAVHYSELNLKWFLNLSVLLIIFSFFLSIYFLIIYKGFYPLFFYLFFYLQRFFPIYLFTSFFFLFYHIPSPLHNHKYIHTYMNAF